MHFHKCYLVLFPIALDYIREYFAYIKNNALQLPTIAFYGKLIIDLTRFHLLLILILRGSSQTHWLSFDNLGYFVW